LTAREAPTGATAAAPFGSPDKGGGDPNRISFFEFCFSSALMSELVSARAAAFHIRPALLWGPQTQGRRMASEIDHTKEMKAHEGTYNSFISIAFKGTIACAVIAAFVIFLITRGGGHH
jgi:hypothetical protein